MWAVYLTETLCSDIEFFNEPPIAIKYDVRQRKNRL